MACKFGRGPLALQGGTDSSCIAGLQEAQEWGTPMKAPQTLSPPSIHTNNQCFFLVTGNMTGKRPAGSVHLLFVICIKLAFSSCCVKQCTNTCWKANLLLLTLTQSSSTNKMDEWKGNGCFTAGLKMKWLDEGHTVKVRWESKLEQVCSSWFWSNTFTMEWSSFHLKWLGWIPPAWMLGKTAARGDIHLLCTDYCLDMLNMPKASSKYFTLGDGETVHCDHSAEQCHQMFAQDLAEGLLDIATSFLICALSWTLSCVGFAWVRTNGCVPASRIWFLDHLEIPVGIPQSLPSHFCKPGGYEGTKSIHKKASVILLSVTGRLSMS